MKIQVGGLSEGVHHFRFEAPAGELDLGDDFPAAVKVEVQLDKTGHQILLVGTVSTVRDFQCDRCITSFALQLGGKYRICYIQEGGEAPELDPSEMQLLPPGMSVIDIADDVRQTVLLSVPLKTLCRADCKGLCPMCGANMNETQCTCSDTTVDHRWDKLRSLPRN